MLKIGDLVKSDISGRIGIITERLWETDYWYVSFGNALCTIHKSRIKLLEIK